MSDTTFNFDAVVSLDVVGLRGRLLSGMFTLIYFTHDHRTTPD